MSNSVIPGLDLISEAPNAVPTIVLDDSVTESKPKPKRIPILPTHRVTQYRKITSITSRDQLGLPLEAFVSDVRNWESEDIVLQEFQKRGNGSQIETKKWEEFRQQYKDSKQEIRVLQQKLLRENESKRRTEREDSRLTPRVTSSSGSHKTSTLLEELKKTNETLKQMITRKDGVIDFWKTRAEEVVQQLVSVRAVNAKMDEKRKRLEERVERLRSERNALRVQTRKHSAQPVITPQVLVANGYQQMYANNSVAKNSDYSKNCYVIHRGQAIPIGDYNTDMTPKDVMNRLADIVNDRTVGQHYDFGVFTFKQLGNSNKATKMRALVVGEHPVLFTFAKDTEYLSGEAVEILVSGHPKYFPKKKVYEDISSNSSVDGL